jgi:nitrogen fixation/metabolism regulation signal transduction histidine kinase
MPRRRLRLGFERKVLWLAALAGLPGAVCTALLLWAGGYGARVNWTVGALVAVSWAAFALAVHGTVVRPLRTLSNLLAALREEDFSFRARGAGGGEDALALAMREVNALADTLREQRLGAVEATALLRTVMDEMEAAVFAFDLDRRLQLVNRAGERLLSSGPESLLGRPADALGLDAALAAPLRAVVDLRFPGRAGRWEVGGGVFRQRGVPHRLLVLTDLSRALREEERQAWQRLIRVLGHELNNSLAAVRSVAGSLEQLLSRSPRPPDWEDDVRSGLAVIGSRADSLARFMEAYGRLARLPPPQLQRVAVAPLMRRVAGLEARVPVRVHDGPELDVPADPGQMEQLLINLVRNAAEAALNAGGEPVEVSWHVHPHALEVHVDDRGPGLPDHANLFVPFFTTKPGGTGVGLVLSRQIAEAHGGTLTLENRQPGPGCRARLLLPRGGAGGRAVSPAAS